MAKEPRENTGEKEEAEEEEEEEKGIARLRFNRSREWFLRENFFAPSKKPRNIRDTVCCLPSRETEATCSSLAAHYIPPRLSTVTTRWICIRLGIPPRFD